MTGLRELAIDASLRTLPETADVLNIVEVGCMFEAGQGTSTLLIAQACERAGIDSRSADFVQDCLCNALMRGREAR